MLTTQQQISHESYQPYCDSFGNVIVESNQVADLCANLPKMSNETPKHTSTLIQSPLNYTGSKFRLLPQILPLFPKDISTMVDLFCGGASVGINVSAKIFC